MSSGTSCVWVKASVLDPSKKPSRSQSIDLDRAGEFSWARCLVVNGDVSLVDDGAAAAHLTIRVIDDSSDFNGQSFELSKFEKGDVVMANEWATGSAAGQNAGSPPDDLISLTHLHEPSVVYALKSRYFDDDIYTATGPILIALNPFKHLPGLYSDDRMGQYWAAGEGLEDIDLKPHTYGMAHSAFRSMMNGLEMRGSGIQSMKVDQSMLVSGESGAGKTVTTKHVMKYLATLSQRKAEHATRRRAASPGRSEHNAPRRSTAGRSQSFRRMSRAMSWKAGALIEEKILESNPIMEAFGNARTIRNDNSSRFGKFIELQFKQTGSLIGASIETYLLEKVRLIHQGPGERNFHIFYEMLAAATEDERKQYFLEDFTVEDFKMTNSSGTYDRRDGEDDATLYDDLVVAMGTMGFAYDLQEDIFKVTIAFLHASNLTFEAVTDDSSKVDESNPHLQPVLTLLGVTLEDFQASMCEFEIEAGNSSYTRTLNKESAMKGLEAFIKGTYGAMFKFIVQTVNKKIDFKPAKNVVRTQGKAASISVLDIFGFESFEDNSFEQLCINYCNEALQQQFNLFIFKTEQEEYKREGIEWQFIEFPDNQEVIDLIEKKGTGILSLLTDTCRTSRGTDKLFLDSMYNKCQKHARFEGTPLDKGKEQFIVKHYAGPVKYSTEGFVEKNKDEFPRGATALLESSTVEFVQLLGKMHATPSGGGSARKGAKRPTVGGQFSSQLSDLRKRIDMTAPHYIRCLKPNQSLQAGEFNSAIIADQLRYAGVLEAIRVSRVGYSQRYSHDNFLQRYRFIALTEVRAADNKDKVTVLTNAIAKKIWEARNPGASPPSNVLTVAGIQQGNTKVFLKQEAFEYMERFRTQRFNSGAVKIQAVARAFLGVCRYKKIQRRILLAQACSRRFLARKIMRAIRQRKAATLIQSVHRMTVDHQIFLQKKTVALWLQTRERGRVGRKIYQDKLDERERLALENRMATKIQATVRAYSAKREVEALKKKAPKKAPSLMPGADAKMRILHEERKKAAYEGYKAKAVAKQENLEKEKALQNLNAQVEGANTATQKAKEARAELLTVKADLDKTKAELEAILLIAESAANRVMALEAENKKLKAKLASGGGGMMSMGASYRNTVYNEFSDLKALDERLHNMAERSKQSKTETEMLVKSLAILN